MRKSFFACLKTFTDVMKIDTEKMCEDIQMMSAKLRMDVRKKEEGDETEEEFEARKVVKRNLEGWECY